MTGTNRTADPDPDPDLDFSVLGPVSVVGGGTTSTPTAPKQRVVLALLLYHANRVVTVPEIVEALWEDRPPPSALAALHGYVSAIRRRLSGAGRVPATTDPRQHPVLQTHPSGYVLRLSPHQLDLSRFRAFAAQGRDRLAERRCEAAAALLGRALACWEGPAFADVRSASVLSHYAARLDEDRLAVLEQRIGAELCLGRAAFVVGELLELCAHHPLREGLHRQLMVALGLTDRQTEALQVFAGVRRRIIDEIGLEPGAGLRALQQAILDGADPLPHRHLHCRG